MQRETTLRPVSTRLPFTKSAPLWVPSYFDVSNPVSIEGILHPLVESGPVGTCPRVRILKRKKLV